jgi:hypothetical protein
MGAMRLPLIAVMLAAAAPGQIILDPAGLTPSLRDFDQRPWANSLRCHVVPLRPVLDFSFRFQTGYVVRVPMNQYFGPGHQWAAITRITPDPDGSPIYLGTRYRLPDVPKTDIELEVGGGFLVGEGAYHVQWELHDDRGRSCRAAWTIEARLSRRDRNVKLAIAPHAVRQFSLVRLPSGHPAANDIRPFPVTILLHAAPVSPRRTWLNARDRVMLLGLLSAILERLPARSVRMVVFSLDQQKEIYRRDPFVPRDIQEVSHALDELELGKVDVSVLHNRHGHVDLLANLVHRELTAPEPSETVLFLGPECRFLGKPSSAALEKPAGTGPRFFYLEYKPVFRGMQASLPDSIAGAIGRLKGKTLLIRTPGEFAKAIEQVERQAKAN